MYHSYYPLAATRRISDCYKTYLWLLILYTNRYQTCQWLLQEISFTTHIYIVKKYHLLLILYTDYYKTYQWLLQDISMTTHLHVQGMQGMIESRMCSLTIECVLLLEISMTTPLHVQGMTEKLQNCYLWLLIFTTYIYYLYLLLIFTTPAGDDREAAKLLLPGYTGMHFFLFFFWKYLIFSRVCVCVCVCACVCMLSLSLSLFLTHTHTHTHTALHWAAAMGHIGCVQVNTYV